MNRTESRNKVSLRLALYKNEVARLPHACFGVSVRQGIAWMTIQGEDRILQAGDAATFEPGRFPAVVTALGATPVILEVMGGERPRAAVLTPARTSVSPARREAAL